VQRRLVEQEIQLLLRLDHPSIIKLCDVVHTSTHVVIVTERARGGEVRESVRRRRC
jgi:serine/threonine protein kinase